MVPGLAAGEVEVEGAEGQGATAARPVDDPEETLPQKPQASPEQPTTSQVADHNLTHLTTGHGARIALKPLGASERTASRTLPAE